MRTFILMLVLLVGVFGSTPSYGMFISRETRPVPIGRLLTNLTQRLSANSNDFELTYQLARVYSMAYATNLKEFEVVKEPVRVGREKSALVPVFGYPGSDSGVPEMTPVFKTPQDRTNALKHLTKAIGLYEQALALLKQSTNKDDQIWVILRTQLGYAWCLDQSGQRDKALDNYRKTLNVAWKLEVIGDRKIKELVNDFWNDVRSLKNPIHSHDRTYLGPGVSYSQEAIGYMLKLLDPKKDAKEIADLQARQKKLQSMGRAITPILVPLEADATFDSLVNPKAGVTFDLDGSGLPRKWGWITPKAAWLVYDAGGSGRITSGLQMFGSVSFWIFWRDGYAALASLDDNGDGFLEGDELLGLALWQDKNSDGISDAGEVHPLQFLGVKKISVSGQPFANGGSWSPVGIVFSDGTMRPTYDWIAPSE